MSAQEECSTAGEARLRGVASGLASALAAKARAHSQDVRCRTPFAVERQLHTTPPLLRALNAAAGGKPDDITVVVGIVQ